ncbi:MAG: hypothetical protein VX527_02265 [Planctomycetota bacterium]|nr:hypothetical protein [Planctomycetota bacterium]
MSLPGFVRRVMRLTLMLAVFLPGIIQISCTDRSRAINAGLRDQIHELKKENQALNLRIKELEIQLEAAGEATAAPTSAGHPAIPVVTDISIDATSGRRQQADQSGNRPLEIHVKGVDGHNRPVQLAGSMRVQVTLIAEGRPPKELCTLDLTAQEVRDAWRGGVFGAPTWLVSVPLRDEDLPPGTRMVDVDIFYKDLRTGQQLVCGDKVDIR